MRTKVGTKVLATCLISVFSVTVGTATGAQHEAATGTEEIGVFEAYPDEIQARLEQRQRDLLSLPNTIPSGQPLYLVITRYRLWPEGDTVTVGFKGGSRALRKAIEKEAQMWAQYGNLTLEFKDEGTGQYYPWKWTEQDEGGEEKTFTTDIRISFDQPGYWSLVGIDSLDPDIVTSDEASMNLQGFDLLMFHGLESDLPEDKAATVVHEFGHALGFQHEHQSPEGGCDQEFKWEDDQNGPGVYSMLGGPPNYWPKWKVDHNLRQLQDSDAFLATPHDITSIMHYSFPPYMFHRGEASQCFTNPNPLLSQLDQVGMCSSYKYPDSQCASFVESAPPGTLSMLEIDPGQRFVRHPRNLTAREDLEALKRMEKLPAGVRTVIDKYLSRLPE